MFKAPLDLAKSRILVTNDDGINAPGLKVLEKVARSLTKDVWVVAPEIEQSGAGHSLTLRRPLQVRRLSARRFAVDGTPTDCVLLAVHHLIPKRRPDLVLSGVNRGGNLGEDVTYSGTIAAAMESTLLEIPAIALSQMRDGLKIRWHTAEHYAPDIIKKLTSLNWPKGVLMNINFPSVATAAVKGVHFVRQGRRAAGIEIIPTKDPVGRPYLWVGDFTSDDSVGRDTDLATVRNGAIAVTPLHLDLTHGAMLRQLQKAFA